MAKRSRLSKVERTRQFYFRWSRKRPIFGLSVGIFLGDKKAEQATFDKIEQALLLIRTFDARRFAQIQHDVRSILLFGSPSLLGCWMESLRLIELDTKYVTAPATSVAEIASILVHEANHARLSRLGFGYEEPDRLQVERICVKAEYAFARRLPLGGPQREQAARNVAYYAKDYFSNENLWEREMAANFQTLRDNKCPAWIIRLLEQRHARILKAWHKRAATAL